MELAKEASGSGGSAVAGRWGGRWRADRIRQPRRVLRGGADRVGGVAEVALEAFGELGTVDAERLLEVLEVAPHGAHLASSG